MHYRRIGTSRPPPVFELRVRTALSRIGDTKSLSFPARHLMPRLHDYIESMLLAENRTPTPDNIAALMVGFSELVALSQAGKSFIFRKRDTISLLFDVTALQSEMCIKSPDDLVLGYTQSMMGFLLFNPDPRQIGMIGLGGGSLAKFCYRHLPDASIEVAEIDPQVIALRRHFLIPEDDERLRVHCMDGAEFLLQASSKFDVLMIDGFDRTGQPPQLCSQRFYDSCHRALMSDGIMVVNLLGDTAETEVYIDRIRLAFDGAMIAIDAPDSLNKIVFACKGKLLNQTEHILKSRMRNLGSMHHMMMSWTAQNILARRRLQTLPKRSSSQEENGFDESA